MSIPIKPNLVTWPYVRDLRDWFAGQALAGYIALPEPGVPQPIDEWNHDAIARGCYKMADAMLAARKEKP